MCKVIFFFFLLVAPFSFGQKIKGDALQKRPKIGLVLSGGGAKGFAHVGVLKIIEKSGLKIDYIGGTSMGAAVGALYATGYAAKQVDSIINAIDFMDMLTDKIDRKYASFFDKKQQDKYLFSFPIKDKKIGLPLAFSKGQNTYNKLSELFHPVSGITDFSKLPIPFFCVATNIENGEEVEINGGSLPLAIRSSASLPTLLSPSRIGSLLLIDGGISNNFPVENMKKKGVDIIIAVDVQGVLKKQENIDSAIEVVDQIVNFQLYGKKYNEKNNLVDIYIHPDVGDYGLVDFERKSDIIKAGETEATKYTAVLKKLAQTAKTSLSTIY